MALVSHKSSRPLSGGNGGSGTNGGDGGSAGIMGTITGTSLNGEIVYLQTQISGGDGGDSTTGMGGSGADVTLSNAVAAFSSGLVYVEQSAYGGNAGGSTGGGVAGVAGNASSSLTIDTAHGNQAAPQTPTLHCRHSAGMAARLTPVLTVEPLSHRPALRNQVT